jgi:hypothetical protein
MEVRFFRAPCNTTQAHVSHGPVRMMCHISNQMYAMSTSMKISFSPQNLLLKIIINRCFIQSDTVLYIVKDVFIFVQLFSSPMVSL